jgi:phage tail-like protein
MRDERAGAPRRVVVQLRDEARRPVAEWALSGARPAKLEGPALNAKGSDVVVEQLELACECVTVDLHSGPAPN